jgi:hypothetical protein
MSPTNSISQLIFCQLHNSVYHRNEEKILVNKCDKLCQSRSLNFFSRERALECFSLVFEIWYVRISSPITLHLCSLTLCIVLHINFFLMTVYNINVNNYIYDIKLTQECINIIVNHRLIYYLINLSISILVVNMKFHFDSNIIAR